MEQMCRHVGRLMAENLTHGLSGLVEQSRRDAHSAGGRVTATEGAPETRTQLNVECAPKRGHMPEFRPRKKPAFSCAGIHLIVAP
jgi:hypothetical protein